MESSIRLIECDLNAGLTMIVSIHVSLEFTDEVARVVTTPPDAWPDCLLEALNLGFLK